MRRVFTCLLVGCSIMLVVGCTSGEPNDATPVVDADEDGFGAGVDCDDGDVQTYPAAQEQCDSRDNDCDGEVDEGVLLSFYADGDADGYGVDDGIELACTIPVGFSAAAGDCDDANPEVNPAAAEVCDVVPDNDCDGVSDPLEVDGDGDGTSSCGGDCVVDRA